jgi:hypothetical protein
LWTDISGQHPYLWLRPKSSIGSGAAGAFPFLVGAAGDDPLTAYPNPRQNPLFQHGVHLQAPNVQPLCDLGHGDAAADLALLLDHGWPPSRPFIQMRLLPRGPKTMRSGASPGQSGQFERLISVTLSSFLSSFS